MIFKHATFLCLSNLSPESALTHADVDYRAGDMELKIQQFLTASSQEHSIEQFACFIKSNDIGLCVLASIKIISYRAFSVITLGLLSHQLIQMRIQETIRWIQREVVQGLCNCTMHYVHDILGFCVIRVPSLH